MTSTIYIDCSLLCQNPSLNAGIQRVVRNLLRERRILEEGTGHVIKAVKIIDGRFEILDAESLSKNPINEYSTDKPATNVSQETSRRKVISILRKAAETNVLAAGLVRMMLKSYSIYRQLRGQLRYNNLWPIKVDSDSILLLLDASWNLNIWTTVNRFKKQGGRAVFVVYDLIPLTHPQFCQASHVEIFTKWFKKTIRYADRYIAISEFVANEVRAHLNGSSQPIVTHFHLGADLSSSSVTAEPSSTLAKIFTDSTAYISVSTIEPRKNHAFILDSFEQLWNLGLDLKLVLIGRTGWHSEAFISRVRQHNEFGIRLFLLDDVNDSELVWCYQHAQAAILASFVEGFGLPIIEALHYGTRVFASDTPIHREVGVDKAVFFDLNDPNSLASIIKEDRKDVSGIDYTNLKVLSWRDSAAALARAITTPGH